jgi:hypothetical protein
LFIGDCSSVIVGRVGILTHAFCQASVDLGSAKGQTRFFGCLGYRVSSGFFGFLTPLLSQSTMLSRMRNAAPADNVVLRAAIEEIQSCLPAHWSAKVAVRTNDASDARLVIKTPAGANAAVAIASKRQLDPGLVPEAADALRAVAADGFLIVSPFLGARTRERLLARGIGYVDLAGNVRLALDRPSILIDRRGQEKNPWQKQRGTRALDGRKASRIVRALCDAAPPHGVRRLAERAGTDPGYVSRLLALLEREELIHRDARGPVDEVDVPGLIRRWATEYRFLEANRPLLCFDVGGPRALLCRLREADIPYAVTGRASAAALSHHPLPGTIACYVDNPERVARRLDLRPDRAGANVVLLEPFDPVVFDHTWERDGVRHAALSQIAADLLGSPAPGPQEAAALLAHIKA